MIKERGRERWRKRTKGVSKGVDEHGLTRQRWAVLPWMSSFKPEAATTVPKNVVTDERFTHKVGFTLVRKERRLKGGLKPTQEPMPGRWHSGDQAHVHPAIPKLALLQHTGNQRFPHVAARCQTQGGSQESQGSVAMLPAGGSSAPPGAK